MIKQNQGKIEFLNGLSDGGIILGSYFFATYLRFEAQKGALTLSEVWSGTYLKVAVFYSALSVFIFYLRNFYTPNRHKRLRDQCFEIIIWDSISILILAAILYFSAVEVFSRKSTFYFYCVYTFLLLLKRVIMREFIVYWRKKGYNQRHVVVVGNGHLAFEYIQSIQKDTEMGYTVDGYVSKYAKEELGEPLGAYEDLDVILDDPGIDEVVVALEPHEVHFMKMIIDASEKQGVKVSIIPFFNDYIPAKPSVDVVGDTRLFNIRSIPLDDNFNAFIKRAFDIVFSLVAIILTSPIMLVAFIGVKTTGGKGSVIFKQERVGRNKKNFTMYKFRSMKVNDESNTAWSSNEDNRKTKFGSIIRKLSVDELPQFFNVLKGDMSVIGPRPEIPFYVNQFKEEIPLYMVRHQVRPGITGWAQVNGYRGDTSIQKRIELDVWYIENWSFSLDMKIVFMTIFGGMVNKEKVNL